MLKEISEAIAQEVKARLEKISLREEQTTGDNGTFKVVASDETVDRVWEVIQITGRDLENYMKNPIVLFGHDYRDVDNIVWKATRVYVEKGQLIIEWVFASTENAQICRKLYDEWILKTVSVGFIPKQRDPEDQTLITKAELLEVSFVPVPANPNALSLDKSIIEKCITIWILTNEIEKKDIAIDEKPHVAPIPWAWEGGNGDDPKNPADINEKLEKINEVLEKFATRIEAKIDEMSNTILKHIDSISTKANDKAEDDEHTTEETLEETKENLQKVAKIVSDALHNIKIKI